MGQQIAQIEKITGNPVSVGPITGSDRKTIYAGVNDDRRRVRHECPGATAEEAVAALLEAVTQ